MGIRAVIFDVSGTLIDPKSSERAHKTILTKIFGDSKKAEAVFAKFMDYVCEIVNKASLHGNYKNYYEICYEALLKILDNEKYKITLNDYKKLYMEIVPQVEELFPEVIPILEMLRKKYKMGVVTDGDREYIERLFELKGLSKFFDVVVCSEDVNEYKPNPKAFKKALELLDVQAEEAIYIGDNPIKDKEGPERVGMKAIIVENGISLNNIRHLLEGFKNGDS